MSRTRRSAWSAASGLILTACTVLLGFAATPWILRWLSPDRFGTWKVVSEWFAYLPLFEFGLSGSLAAHLAPALGRGDETEVRSFLVAGLRAYRRLVPYMLAAGLALAFGLPHLGAFKAMPAAELRWALLLMMIPILWLPLSAFRVLAEARQRLYTVNLLLGAQALFMSVLMLIAAYLDWGLPGQAAATVVAQLPTMAVLTWMGRQGGRGGLGDFETDGAFRKLQSLNWPTFLFNVSGKLGLLSDNIVIAGMLGPTAVASFYLTQRLANMALIQVQGIGNASWAGLVELHAQGRTSVFHARTLELTGLTSGLSLALLGPIAAYSGQFTTLWVGATSYAGDLVATLACLNSWILCLFSLWSWIVSGTGNIRVWTPYALLFTAINVIASVGMTLLFGMPGPLLGTTIAFLFVYVWALPLVLKQLFGFEQADLWAAALKPLLWGLPFVVALFLTSRSAPPLTWWRLLVELGGSALIGLALWWRLTLDPDSRSRWRMRVRTAVVAN